MNRTYTAHSPYSLTPTERIDAYADETVDEFEYDGLQEYDEYAELPEYDEASIDRRWMWIAGIAGIILFIAVGTTGVILGGGDSGSVSATATSAAPSSSASPAATSTPKPAAAAPPLSPSLPAETVTTVSPTAEAAPAAPAAPEAAPPPAPAPPAPNTITYMVTGNRQLIDMVTVIYTDSQGALQTDVNVALPWVKQVVLDPGVSLGSVTATSVAGQLNCSITDAAGTLVAVQNNNTMIANCLK
jgi:hypothetical protein